MMENSEKYSVAKEISIALFVGLLVGLTMVVVGVGLVEFLKG